MAERGAEMGAVSLTYMRRLRETLGEVDGAVDAHERAIVSEKLAHLATSLSTSLWFDLGHIVGQEVAKRDRQRRGAKKRRK